MQELPAPARLGVAGLLAQFRIVDARVAKYDQQIRELAAVGEAAQRLMKIEGIGPQTVTARVATMGFEGLRQRPQLRRSPRAHAATEIKRRQGATREDHS
jgi:transposase